MFRKALLVLYFFAGLSLLNAAAEKYSREDDLERLDRAIEKGVLYYPEPGLGWRLGRNVGSRRKCSAHHDAYRLRESISKEKIKNEKISFYLSCRRCCTGNGLRSQGEFPVRV